MRRPVTTIVIACPRCTGKGWYATHYGGRDGCTMCRSSGSVLADIRPPEAMRKPITFPTTTSETPT